MKTLLVMTAFVSFQMASAQKTKELKDFKNVSIGADTKVTLIKSSSNKLVIHGDDEELSVINNGGSLILNGEDLDITLYYKDNLESLSAASDAEVYGKDEIKSKEFTINVSSDAKVELVINVKKLVTSASSDAEITISGKATEHTAEISSDASFRGQDLLTESTNIVVSSDGVAVIFAKDTVNATVSSDGMLTVYGNPKKVNEVTADDGEIKIMK